MPVITFRWHIYIYVFNLVLLHFRYLNIAGIGYVLGYIMSLVTSETGTKLQANIKLMFVNASFGLIGTPGAMLNVSSKKI